MKNLFKKYGQLIIWVLVILVIIILALTSPNKEKTKDVAPEKQVTESPVSQAIEDSGFVGVTTPALENGNMTAMKPYASDTYEHSFNKINWDLEEDTATGITKVGFRLDGFTRWKGGEPANILRPFFAGVFTGPCESIGYTAPEVANTALAFLGCGSGSDSVVIGIFQEENLLHVLAQKSGETGFSSLRDPIDLTTIIK